MKILLVASKNTGHESLMCVDKFCYLGDVTGIRDGAETSPVTTVKSKVKFTELIFLLTVRGFLYI